MSLPVNNLNSQTFNVNHTSNLNHTSNNISNKTHYHSYMMI